MNMASPRILLLGIGNPGRGDDGLGPALAAYVERLAIAGVEVDADYQLAPEHAAAMLHRDLVVVADACVTGPAGFRFERVEPRHLPREMQTASPLPTTGPLPVNWEDFKRLKRQVHENVVDSLERRFLQEALQRAGGNVTRAAEEVQMQRTNFHALMRKHGLGPAGEA